MVTRAVRARKLAPLMRVTTMLRSSVVPLRAGYVWDDEWNAFVPALQCRQKTEEASTLWTYAVDAKSPADIRPITQDALIAPGHTEMIVAAAFLLKLKMDG